MSLCPIKAIKCQLYLLQLENYNLSRFGKIFWRGIKKQRKKIEWTAKLKVVALISFLFQFSFTLLIGRFLYLNYNLTATVIVAIAVLYLLSLFFGVCLVISVIILWPLDYILKQKIINKAKDKIKRYPNLKIIGITGSYGKTTVKEAISEILSQKYKVLKTDENKNTPLGISKLILNELNEEIDFFVVEMGAYQIRDIKKLCEIARPDIAVLTGINESHLERFGSIKNIIKGKFEIIENAKPEAKIILNADDKRVLENYEQYAGGREIEFYSANNRTGCKYKIANKQFLPNAQGWQADILNAEKDIGNIKTPILGEYIFGAIIAGIIIAREFGLSIEQIRHGISAVKPVEHRLQKVLSGGKVIVIDDSYNGNVDGAYEAIKVLAEFKGKRKIYVTPGLVELGEKSGDIHYNMGKRLAEVADIVLLIKNSATFFIEKGLLKKGFNKENIILFDSAPTAHKGIKDITKEGDVILFQNDWPDNYI